MANHWIMGEYRGGHFKIRPTTRCEWEILLPQRNFRVTGRAGSYRVARKMIEGIIEALLNRD